MRAEILTIGDELCRGEIVDTNSSWMADRLWEMGVEVHWMTSCRDVADDMRRVFRDAAGDRPKTISRSTSWPSSAAPPRWSTSRRCRR